MSDSAAIDHAVASLASGEELMAATRLTGGVSATVYKLELAITDGDRRLVVFRQHQGPDTSEEKLGQVKKEHDLLRHLNQGGFAVPLPYLYSAGNDAIEPYLVMEWVGGATDVSPDGLPTAIEQMADFLDRLHGCSLTDELARILPPIEDPAIDSLKYLPDTREGEAASRLLTSGRPWPRANQKALIHGDYWPGNVMWRDAKLVAVIDWEDSCIGDPLADLAAARVELLCRYGRKAMDDFTTAYRQRRAVSDPAWTVEALPLWEVYVSAASLASMHLWGLPADEEAARRALTQQFFNRATAELSSVPTT